MKKFLLTLFTILLPVTGLLAQDIYINPQDSSFRAKYATVEFGDRFAVLVLSDQAHDYYLVDFSQLTGEFEKVYFMNLVFKGDKVVNIDGDLTRDRIWFSAVKGSGEEAIRNYFTGLKKKCERASESFTETEKTEWLKKTNKY
jgi:hypothetical protein